MKRNTSNNLIKIHKLSLLQLLRSIFWFCLEIWGGDHCGEHRPWQTWMLTAQLSLEACCWKNLAFLLRDQAWDAQSYFFRVKIAWVLTYKVESEHMSSWCACSFTQEAVKKQQHEYLVPNSEVFLNLDNWSLEVELFSRLVTRCNDIFPMRIWILVRFISKPSSRQSSSLLRCLQLKNKTHHFCWNTLLVI